MISAKRIVNLFHQTGGDDEFTKSGDSVTNEEWSFLHEDLVGDQPLLVGIHSKDDWFAITSLCLVLKNRNGLLRIPLENIEWVVTQDHDYKLRGGNLGVKLR